VTKTKFTRFLAKSCMSVYHGKHTSVNELFYIQANRTYMFNQFNKRIRCGILSNDFPVWLCVRTVR